MAYWMNIGVLLDMDILLLYCVPRFPPPSRLTFFNVFSETRVTRLVYPQIFLPVTFHYHYHYDVSMINALDYVALIRCDRRNMVRHDGAPGGRPMEKRIL